MLDKLQKWIYRTVGPSPVGSSFTLVNVTCSSELAQLVPIPYFLGNSIYYSDRSHDFLSPVLDVRKLSMSTVSFLAQLESGILSTECFLLTYDLNGLKSRINRHLLTVGSF